MWSVWFLFAHAICSRATTKNDVLNGHRECGMFRTLRTRLIARAPAGGRCYGCEKWGDVELLSLIDSFNLRSKQFEITPNDSAPKSFFLLVLFHIFNLFCFCPCLCSSFLCILLHFATFFFFLLSSPFLFPTTVSSNFRWAARVTWLNTFILIDGLNQNLNFWWP